MPFFTSFSGKILSAPGLKLGPKIFQFIKTFTSSVQEYNLRNDLLANGWDGVTPVDAQITVNSGVYVWSDNISTAAFTTGSLVADSVISIINNGYIIGKGGHSDSYNGAFNTSTITSVQSGGPAINLNYPVSITNNSYIAGGGGGGRSVWDNTYNYAFRGGGGGAGGGNGGYVLESGQGPYNIAPPAGWNTTMHPGYGGAVGATGTYGGGISHYYFSFWIGGGGGGRILPGTGGIGTRNMTWYLSGGYDIFNSGFAQGGGAGGGAANGYPINNPPNGADGGSANNPGGTGIANNSTAGAGGGGGWGASGGSSSSGLSGGGGGKCVNLNGNSVTWLATGNRYGAIS